jgi:Fe2+ or Zn2+ uptake regulation protein
MTDLNKITNSHNEKLDAEVIDYQLRQEDGKIYLETIYLAIFFFAHLKSVNWLFYSNVEKYV